MATIQNFEDLKVWQKARLLCKEVFSLTSVGSLSKDFALKDQINRSTGSIMDNIAEGFGRKGNLEFINFLTYSCGSACECKSQLYRAFDRNHITEEKRKELSYGNPLSEDQVEHQEQDRGTQEVDAGPLDEAEAA